MNSQTKSRHENREDEDLVLNAFLDLIAEDIDNNPGTIQALDQNSAMRVKELVRNVKTYRDEDLGDEAFI